MKKTLLLLALILSLLLLFSCGSPFDNKGDGSIKGEVADLDSLIDSIMNAGFSDTRDRLTYILSLFLPDVESEKAISSYEIDKDGILTLIYNDSTEIEFGKIIYPPGTRFFVITFEGDESIPPVLVAGNTPPVLTKPNKTDAEFVGWNYKDAESGEWLSYDESAAVNKDLILKPIWKSTAVEKPDEDEKPSEPDVTVLEEALVTSLDELADAIMKAGFTDTLERLLTFLEGYKFYSPEDALIPSSYKLFSDGTVTVGYSGGVTRSLGKLIYPAGTVLHIISFEGLAMVDHIPPIIVADGKVPTLPTIFEKPDMTFVGWKYYDESSSRLFTYDTSKAVTEDIRLTPIWQSAKPDVKIFPIASVIDGNGNSLEFEQIADGTCYIRLVAGQTQRITIYLTEKRVLEPSFDYFDEEAISLSEVSYTEDVDGYAAALVIEVRIANLGESHTASFTYDMESEMFSYFFNFTTEDGNPSAEAKFKYASIDGGQNTTDTLLVLPDTKSDLFIYFTQEISSVSVKLYKNGDLIGVPELYSVGTYALGYACWFYLTVPGEGEAELEITWKATPTSAENTEIYTVKSYYPEPEDTIPDYSSLTVTEGGDHKNYDVVNEALTFEEETEVSLTLDLLYIRGKECEGISVKLDDKDVTITSEYIGEFFYCVEICFTVPAHGDHTLSVFYKTNKVVDIKLTSTPKTQTTPIDPNAVTTARFTGVYANDRSDASPIRTKLEASADSTVIYLGFTEEVRRISVTVCSSADPNLTSATVTEIGEITSTGRIPITLNALRAGNHILTVTYSSPNAPDSKTSTVGFVAVNRSTSHVNGFYGYGDYDIDFPSMMPPNAPRNTDNTIKLYFAQSAVLTAFDDGIGGKLNYIGIENGMLVYSLFIPKDTEDEFLSPLLSFTYTYNGESYTINTFPVRPA